MANDEKSVPVLIHLRRSDIRTADKLAGQRGLNRSAMIRILIQEAGRREGRPA